jgi:threonine aldolase
MVYVSEPTEYGTLYSRGELEALRDVCNEYQLKLYVDGARLAYALACDQNDVSLADLARLCDVFYIGGTKCGALLGEAVVVPNPATLQHFFTIVKQHGALIAKGWVLGVQFDELFSDDLYLRIGQPAIASAQRICESLVQNGYRLAFDSPTNQIFVILTNEDTQRLSQTVEFSFWEKHDASHTVIRFATSWATTKQQTDMLLSVLERQA